MIRKILSKPDIEWYVKLKMSYVSLTNSERAAADYLLLYREEIAERAIAEVAKEAGCSQATLVRLAKKIGYDGFPELRKAIIDMSARVPFPMYPFLREGDSYRDIVHKIFAVTTQTIGDTLSVLSIDEFQKTVEVLGNASRIAFIAIGNAVPVALYGHYKFLRAGVACSFLSDPDMAIVSGLFLSPGDVAIAVSHSGRNRNVLNAVETAKKSGAYCVAITNYPNSPLADLCHSVLLTSAFVENADGDVLADRVAQLCVVESLYVAIQMKRPAAPKNIHNALEAISCNRV